MHRTEPSRIQGLSLQLMDKINHLVDFNEKLYEMKQNAGSQNKQHGKRYDGRNDQNRNMHKGRDNRRQHNKGPHHNQHRNKRPNPHRNPAENQV